MATWNKPNAEARDLGTTFDIIRRKYLRQLAELTGRLDRPKHPGTSIGDTDTIGLMTGAGGLGPAPTPSWTGSSTA